MDGKVLLQANNIDVQNRDSTFYDIYFKGDFSAHHAKSQCLCGFAGNVELKQLTKSKQTSISYRRLYIRLANRKSSTKRPHCRLSIGSNEAVLKNNRGLGVGQPRTWIMPTTPPLIITIAITSTAAAHARPNQRHFAMNESSLAHLA